MHEKLQSTSAPEEEVTAEDEELVEKCIEIIRQEKRASYFVAPTQVTTWLYARGANR
jgi:hypothetical protein